MAITELLAGNESLVSIGRTRSRSRSSMSSVHSSAYNTDKAHITQESYLPQPEIRGEKDIDTEDIDKIEEHSNHNKTARNSLANLSISERTEDDTSTVGYISIKDFAYEESDPLHYGYFDDDNEQTEDQVSDDLISNEQDNNDNRHKRQSVVLPSDYIINQKAVALYDFEPENDNELELKEGDVVFIGYRHGQGWLVAENNSRTKTGLVPEEFVSYIEADEYEEDVLRPFYLTQLISQGLQTTHISDNTAATNRTAQYDNDHKDDEWEDIDEED